MYRLNPFNIDSVPLIKNLRKLYYDFDLFKHFLKFKYKTIKAGIGGVYISNGELYRLMGSDG